MLRPGLDRIGENINMRILIACEFSGIVRDAFIAKGHEAVSVDLMESERPGSHIIGDVMSIIDDGWDMMIAFPPCTYICRSGQRWHSGTTRMHDAIEFVRKLMYCDIPMIAIENPIGRLSSHIRKPDQIIQPWQFGHPETKATCLWLKSLPRLTPTRVINDRSDRLYKLGPSPDRATERSRTFTGIANAMAGQWG